jgi:membrane protease YdiL (CAAX protease family)
VTPRADFLLRLAVSVAVTLALAPVLGLLFPATPFHRVTTRLLQITLVVALVVRRGPPRAWPDKLRAMGFRGPHRLRRVLLGAGAGALLLSLILLLSWIVGGRTVATPHRLPFLVHLLEAAAAAIGVSLFEEILVRGYMKDAIGGLWSALLFGGVHYVQPLARTAPAGEAYDPLLAVKRLPELVEAWGDPQNATLGFLSLVVFSLALNRLRDRTGTLYLGMGIHAGLVLVLAMYRRFLEDDPVQSRWIHGGTRVHDGLLPLLALLLLLLASYRAPLPPWARA